MVGYDGYDGDCDGYKTLTFTSLAFSDNWIIGGYSYLACSVCSVTKYIYVSLERLIN